MHFGAKIPLPAEATLSPYKCHHTSTKVKKSKHKFDEFTYYRIDGGKTIKLLFKDDTNYQLQGSFPFTDPEVSMQTKADLDKLNPKKLIKTEAAYIGHYGDNIVIKKMQGVKLGKDGSEFDTVDDNFEVVPVGNKERFLQFLRILGSNPKAVQISIRVVIDESDLDAPKIIDYEFFKRESQIKASKAFKPES